MEIITLTVGAILYFLVKYALSIIQYRQISRLVDEKTDMFFEKEHRKFSSLSDEYEKEQIEETNKQHIQQYGYDAVFTVHQLYHKYSPVITAVQEELQRQFPISPEFLSYGKVTKVVDSLPQEKSTLLFLSREVLLISCALDIGVVDVLSILKERWSLSNSLIIPLHISTLNEIDRRNAEGEREWLSAISTAEIILSIARNTDVENWELCSVLDNEFNIRLQGGAVKAGTFRSLLSLSSQIDTMMNFQKQTKDDEKKHKVNDRHFSSLIETINHYNKKYNAYVYSNQHSTGK